ncbi:MAG TPA: hypothetical protein VLX44_16365 [Xanthobacteraceae bacterium]|nr:hypothetical protein [Xanthobacteraceae bacterium]
MAVAALAALLGVAYARSAGTKPAVAVPVGSDDPVVTSSIKKNGEATGDDVTGSIKKPKTHHHKAER